MMVDLRTRAQDPAQRDQIIDAALVCLLACVRAMRQGEAVPGLPADFAQFSPQVRGELSETEFVRALVHTACLVLAEQLAQRNA